MNAVRQEKEKGKENKQTNKTATASWKQAK